MIANEQDLLRRLQSSNATESRKAFREFVESNERRVYALAYHLTGNAWDAEDLAQEVFVKAFLHIDKFQGQSRLFTWLHRMTVNAYLDNKRSSAYRTLRDAEELDDETESASERRPDESAGDTIEAERIAAAVEKLSPQQRAVFVLRHYHERQLDEIAETLKVTQGTVKTLLFRAVRRLRELLAPYYRELDIQPIHDEHKP